MKFPICISNDATGHGKLQLNTIIARNPWLGKSAFRARIFGLGNCDDGRNGTVRLLGDNLEKINTLIEADKASRCVEIDISERDAAIAQIVAVVPAVFIVQDLSAVRHCEHVAASGVCGCSREFALRDVPKKPADIPEML